MLLFSVLCLLGSTSAQLASWPYQSFYQDLFNGAVPAAGGLGLPPCAPMARIELVPPAPCYSPVAGPGYAPGLEAPGPVTLPAPVPAPSYGVAPVPAPPPGYAPALPVTLPAPVPAPGYGPAPVPLPAQAYAPALAPAPAPTPIPAPAAPGYAPAYNPSLPAPGYGPSPAPQPTRYPGFAPGYGPAPGPIAPGYASPPAPAPAPSPLLRSPVPCQTCSMSSLFSLTPTYLAPGASPISPRFYPRG